MSNYADKKRAGLRKRAGKFYRSSGVESANKLDLLILTHDVAIDAAKARNRLELEKALKVLTDGVDISASPVFALSLLDVYKQCELAAEHGHFPEAIQLLSVHREAWKELRKSEKSRAVKAEGE